MKAVETRHLYRFENISTAVSKYANATRSEKTLREIARNVWAKHGRKGRRCPEVVVVDGAKWSTCSGHSLIELATAAATKGNQPHNTIGVLLHEMTHAMGYGTHGRGFVRKYFQLLVEYGKCDLPALILDAHLLKVKT